MCASVAAISRYSPATSRFERAHRVEVLEVLLGDERDRDVEDVELVLLDQVQQQIERTLEDVELDLVAGRGVASSASIPMQPTAERAGSTHAAGTVKNLRQLRDEHERHAG